MLRVRRATKVPVVYQTIQDNVINLRLCNVGDILVSKHGKMFEYLEPTPLLCFDHNIRAVEGEDKGQIYSRTHNGQEFRRNRTLFDHDINQVLRTKLN